MIISNDATVVFLSRRRPPVAENPVGRDPQTPPKASQTLNPKHETRNKQSTQTPNTNSSNQKNKIRCVAALRCVAARNKLIFIAAIAVRKRYVAKKQQCCLISTTSDLFAALSSSP